MKPAPAGKGLQERSAISDSAADDCGCYCPQTSLCFTAVKTGDVAIKLKPGKNGMSAGTGSKEFYRSPGWIGQLMEASNSVDTFFFIGPKQIYRRTLKQILDENKMKKNLRVILLLCITESIYSNICHGTSLKKPSGNVGTRTSVAGISSQQTCFIL